LHQGTQVYVGHPTNKVSVTAVVQTDAVGVGVQIGVIVLIVTIVFSISLFTFSMTGTGLFKSQGVALCGHAGGTHGGTTVFVTVGQGAEEGLFDGFTNEIVVGTGLTAEAVGSGAAPRPQDM